VTVDLVGRRFGRLVAVERIRTFGAGGRGGRTDYVCQCDCGKRITVFHGNLKRNGYRHTVSCGCYHAEIRHLPMRDLAGRRFGMLVAEAPLHHKGSPRWLCACDCGEHATPTTAGLMSGRHQSCGCQRSRRFTGSDNPRYNPALTDQDRRDIYFSRTGKAHTDWARGVITRDGACVICGSRQRLEAHHIEDWGARPDLRYVPSNGVTLCFRHHRSKGVGLHSMFPHGPYSADVYAAFRKRVA